MYTMLVTGTGEQFETACSEQAQVLADHYRCPVILLVGDIYLDDFYPAGLWVEGNDTCH